MTEIATARRRLHVVSDFNASVLERFLTSRQREVPWSVSTAPFGQLTPALIGDAPDGAEFGLVWSRPEIAAPTFGEALGGRRNASGEKILQEVEAFGGLLSRYARNFKAVAVPQWVLPPKNRARGPLDFRPGVGVRDTLARMNLRLADALAGAPNVFLLDTNSWLQSVGPAAFDSRLWFAAKSPFSPELYRKAATEIENLVRAVEGRARKLVVVDLDNTLWGGIVGETGPEGITLGGHDAVGEAFCAFQDALLALKNRGVLLAIASKNDESVAMEALRSHPEMRLRPSDFAAYRIDWADKAGNILSIANELNLGLQSVVFIDDNPSERGRVREALPEVFAPDWPMNPMEYPDALTSLACFDLATATAEDADRAGMYAAERNRQEARRTFTTVEEWLQSLSLRVEIHVLAPANLQRAAQLMNKTNQMNLRTRRLAAHELEAWASQETRTTKVFRVRDRFGDSGITGLLSVEQLGPVLEIADFVLSCRVFGRRIENLMLSEAVAEARSRGCRTLRARYSRTPKNGPCLSFLRESGMRRREESVFDWPADSPYLAPSEIVVVHPRA